MLSYGRRRERGKGGGEINLLAPPARSQQISAIYRVAASNPKLSNNWPSRSISIHIQALLPVLGSHRGTGFAPDAGEINPLSPIGSYRHILSSSPAQLTQHRWRTGRAGWLLHLTNRCDSIPPPFFICIFRCLRDRRQNNCCNNDRSGDPRVLPRPRPDYCGSVPGHSAERPVPPGGLH